MTRWHFVATWDPYWSQPRSPSMKAPLVPTQSAALPFLVSPLQRGVHAIRCRPEVCGPILWLGSSNVVLMSCQQRRKSGLLNFSTWPRTNQRKIGWGFFPPHSRFLMEDFKIHIAVPFLWSVSGNIVFTCMRVCRLPSFDWTLSWSQEIPQPCLCHLLAGPENLNWPKQAHRWGLSSQQ